MTRLGFASLVFLFGILLFQARHFFFRNDRSDVLLVTPTPDAPFPSVFPLGTSLLISSSFATYRVFLFEIRPSYSVSLIANFEEQLTGRELVVRHGCTAAINGGFYRTNGTPLGLFVSDGTVLGDVVSSALATGFFWEDSAGGRHIGRLPPEKRRVTFALQTGPLMRVEAARLPIVSDEHARRSLLGITSSQTLFLISVVSEHNMNSGPLLSDIPVLFDQESVTKDTGIAFTTLLNLDGGSASFFFVRDASRTFLLSELVPIGSLLCIRE